MDEMMELHMYKDRIVGDRDCACASLIRLYRKWIKWQAKRHRRPARSASRLVLPALEAAVLLPALEAAVRAQPMVLLCLSHGGRGLVHSFKGSGVRRSISFNPGPF
jgi:hypothetical protein